MIGKTNARGQGSLEYLLIIGGAVAIAAIVIYMVLSSASGSGDASQEQQRRANIATECSAACADISFCNSQNSDWPGRQDCTDACRIVGNESPEINVDECKWDCTVSSGQVAYTAGDYNCLVVPDGVAFGVNDVNGSWVER